jgi:hypothetical protein
MTNALTRLGRVINGYSNYLALLAIDATHVGAWGGPGDDGEGDFARANDLIERGRFEIDVGKGKGVLVEIGGCGMTDVCRIGDTLVMVEHYTGDEDADAEADLDRAIVGTPTKQARRVGRVAVKSGALALCALIEAGAKPSAKQLAKAAKGSVETKYGVLVGVKPGTYEIWTESLGIEGAWGSLDTRVRIVAAGTKVVAGKPIAELPKAKRLVAAKGERRTGIEWTAVSSMALAPDGRAFAGETGGYRACAWAPDGTLAWERSLKKIGKESRYNYELEVALVGDDLLAFATYGEVIWMLDPATGKTRHELTIPKTRAFAVSPDRERLVLRTSTETTVLAYPTLEKLAFFDHYCNNNSIAISHDGRWLAVNGHEVHCFDLDKLKHVATIEPKDGPWQMMFLPDGRLATGDDTGMVRFYDTKGKPLGTLDGAPGRSRKPSITALASSAMHLAVGRNDGTVVLFDAKGTLVKTFDKHDVTQPDTGSTSLGALAFSADGSQLWVSAGLKKQPVGLSVYGV